MIKSMTGFGRGEATANHRTATAEIRSVNHRYCEITVKMPRRYSFAEELLKAKVKESAKRGKIELSVSVSMDEGAEDTGDSTVQLNLPLAKAYQKNLQTLRSELQLNAAQEGMSAETDLRMLALVANQPDVLRLAPNVEDEEAIKQLLLKAVEEACRNLDAMRSVEGAKLADDLLARSAALRGIVGQIKQRAPEVKKEYTEKLKARIKDLLGEQSQGYSEDRILMEAAVFADKSDITEELVRLDSHTLQLDRIITESSEPDGKKLDFLIQEMNREANTICSKANDLTITNHALTLKNEIEKIREQVQNIE